MIYLHPHPKPLPIEPESISLPDVFSEVVNGITFYQLQDNGSQTVTLNLVFDAGKWFETSKAAALFTSIVIRDGSGNRDSNQVAEYLDYHGASLNVSSGSDQMIFTLQCLNQHIPALLELLSEVLESPHFPESELELHKQIQTQQLQVNKEKVEYQATKTFMGNMFGVDHPYGYRIDENTIGKVTCVELKKHFQNSIHQKLKMAVITGGFDKQSLDECKTLIKNASRNSTEIIAPPQHKLTQSIEQFAFVQMPKANQSALRIGKVGLHYTHPDYYGLKVLNTVFGGYFGSRLMTNIREEKGYTYGIYSTLQSFTQTSIWYISTEVGSRHTKDALHEISHEMTRLRTTKISEDELILVRNYLLGNLLGALDGAFKISSTLKGYWIENRNPDELLQFAEIIKSMTPAKLKLLAEQYLDPLTFTTVVSGAEKP